jgi:hypothetical protein
MLPKTYLGLFGQMGSQGKKKQAMLLYCMQQACPENKVLHLMFYSELKLYWMKVYWLYERS